MAANFKRTNLAVNSEADGICTLLNGGYLDIYNGTQPATADTAVTSQTRLARLTLSNPAFGAAVAGVATANAITDDESAAASGEATWFRARKSDGTTGVYDGSAGTADADCLLNRTDIQAGARVRAMAMSYSATKG